LLGKSLSVPDKKVAVNRQVFHGILSGGQPRANMKIETLNSGIV
jgi:hypothetical protein